MIYEHIYVYIYTHTYILIFYGLVGKADVQVNIPM